MLKLVLFLLLFAFAVHGADAATKSADARARQIYVQGEKAYNRHDWKTAIKDWTRVLELKPTSEYTKKMLADARARLAAEEAHSRETANAKPTPPDNKTQGEASISAVGSATSANSEAMFWSSTKTKTAAQNALEHWQKHSQEFPEFHNARQYAEAAADFVIRPPIGTLKKTDPDGDTLFYHPKTNTFAVRSASGAPRTMFRPSDGMRYWDRQ
ncbi:MAG: hypothetical protein WCL39_05405 [Armatimonadota bacterium]